MTFRIVLPEAPAANRFYRNFRGRMVKSPVAARYQSEISTLCALAAREKRFRALPLVGHLAVTIRWYRGRRSGDLDGRLKVLLDAMQGTVYDNDSQIVELHAFRFDDKFNPRMEVEAMALLS